MKLMSLMNMMNLIHLRKLAPTLDDKAEMAKK